MGFFDDMGALVGRGMNVADKKTQVLRLQGELSRLDQSLEVAYANLGRAAYTLASVSPELTTNFPVQVNAITDLLNRQATIRQQIDEVQRMQPRSTNPAIQRYSCPKCGSSVTLDSAYCPTCGDNLSILKARFRRCPSCNVYYTAESLFCENCGSKTIEIPVASPVHVASDLTSDLSDKEPVDPCSDGVAMEPEIAIDANLVGDDETVLETVPVGGISSQTSQPSIAAEQAYCPNCGEPLELGSRFCGNCGTPVV